MTAIHWLSDISGSFTDAADWSGGKVPGPTDDAILDAVGDDYTVTLSNAFNVVNSIQTAVNATLELSNSTLIATSGTGPAKGGGANAGTIVATGFENGLEIGGQFNNTGSVVFMSGTYLTPRSNVTLSGGGLVSLYDGGIVENGSPTVLTNIDNTISGSGYIRTENAATFQMINEARGVIDATDKSEALDITILGGTIVNAGLIEATQKAELLIAGGVIDDSAGGMILAGAGSLVALGAAVIVGGVLDSHAGGAITTTNAGITLLDGEAYAVHNKGQVVINDGQSLEIEGALVNSGRITMDAHGDPTLLSIQPAGVTINGGGKIEMRSRFAEITGLSQTTVLDNVDGEIVGRGQLGGRELTLENQKAGVIAGPTSGSLVIDTGRQTIVNAGLIVSNGAGSVSVRSALANDGSVEADGGVLRVQGAVGGQGSAVVAGGVLDFAAFFNQAVAFDGSAGVLELAQSQAYTSSISGFSVSGGATLNLDDIAFIGAGEASFSGTQSGGVLTVTDGTHIANINLVGDYLDSTFVASSDGAGGTDVIAQSAQTPSAAHFASAMAAITGHGASAGLIDARTVNEGRQMLLAAPRLAIA